MLSSLVTEPDIIKNSNTGEVVVMQDKQQDATITSLCMANSANTLNSIIEGDNITTKPEQPP